MRSACLSTGPGVPTGLEGVGVVPWGTHLCHFYRDADDLRDALVPFFAAGLARGEQCVWVTAAPLDTAAARGALARAVPDLERHEAEGRLEIHDHEAWYLRTAGLDADGVVQQWVDRELDARARGFAGLRLTGNTAWLERDDWDDFVAYEEAVHRAFDGRRILALCSYSLDRCTVEDVLDVLHNHRSALIRQGGKWAYLDSATGVLGLIDASGDRSTTSHGRASPSASVDQLAGLQRVTSALSEVQTSTQLLDVIDREVAPFLGARWVEVAVEADGDLRRLRPGSVELGPRVEAGLLRVAFERVRPRWRNVHGGGASERVAPRVAVPLPVGAQVLGALELSFDPTRRIGPHDRALVDDVTKQVAAALARAHRHERIQRELEEGMGAASHRDMADLGAVGHALRDPLAAVRSAAQVLTAMAEANPELRDVEAALTRQTAQMASVVERLSDRSARGAAAPGRRRTRVLLVEDSDDFAHVLEVALSASGFDLTRVRTGDQALESARATPPDVVVCDIGLPGRLDGYDVARRFRRAPELKRTPLIALTGFGRPEDVRLARAAGFELHFTKPVALDQLRRALRRLPLQTSSAPRAS